ncbi:YetF domain-containing protein [Clostridium botulinum]|uniref:YetF domain-containing protein n=1 Tax=Clostridium botulinum TaxID=1491 RepID=UPI003A7FEAF9
MDIFIRTFYKPLIIFMVLFILIRITGKRHLSEITYYDYISGITIGAIAGTASVDESISIYGGIIALVVWIIVPIIISYINIKNLSYRRLTVGEPLVLIKNGTVNDVNLKKARYNIEDLLMQLRKKDVFNLSEVEFALLEIDGELSVLKKAPYNTVTSKDLNISTPHKGLILNLIVNGRIIESNLRLAGKDRAWLKEQLHLKNVKDITDVIFGGFTSDGQLEVVTKNNLSNSQGSL